MANSKKKNTEEKGLCVMEHSYERGPAGCFLGTCAMLASFLRDLFGVLQEGLN